MSNFSLCLDEGATVSRIVSLYRSNSNCSKRPPSFTVHRRTISSPASQAKYHSLMAEASSSNSLLSSWSYCPKESAVHTRPRKSKVLFIQLKIQKIIRLETDIEKNYRMSYCYFYGMRYLLHFIFSLIYALAFSQGRSVAVIGGGTAGISAAHAIHQLDSTAHI